MLNVTDKKFHGLGPKDVGLSVDKKPTMTIDIARTTNMTGEQIHIAVPIYGDETRQDLNDRVNFAFSFIQDRLEAENAAVAWRSERETIIRRTNEVIRRNQEMLKKKMESLTKTARKQKWDDAKFQTERARIVSEFQTMNAVSEARAAHAKRELDTMSEIPYEGPTDDTETTQEAEA